MFRRDKGRTGATTPSVPPRPSSEELDNPVAHSLNEGEMNAVSQENNSDVKSEPVPKNKAWPRLAGSPRPLRPSRTTLTTCTTAKRWRRYCKTMRITFWTL